jgi:hypothetical protein
MSLFLRIRGWGRELLSEFSIWVTHIEETYLEIQVKTTSQYRGVRAKRLT